MYVIKNMAFFRSEKRPHFICLFLCSKMLLLFSKQLFEMMRKIIRACLIYRLKSLEIESKQVANYFFLQTNNIANIISTEKMAAIAK